MPARKKRLTYMIISLLSILIMNCPLIIVAAAATESPIVTIATVNAMPGTTVNVPLSIDVPGGMAGYGLEIQYDPSVLTPSTTVQIGTTGGISGQTYNPAYSTNTIFVAWSGSSVLTSGGSLVVVTFTVNSNAKSGNTSLSWCAANIVVNDINGSDITNNFSFINGAINVQATANDTDAELSDLQINGTTVAGFTPATHIYDVVLAAGTTTVPTVTAIANDTSKATAVVTAAAGLPGATTILVTAEDGATTQAYTINFTVRAIGIPIFMIGTAEAKPGATVSVPISINDQVGIAGYGLEIQYDPSILTPATTVQIGTASGISDQTYNPTYSANTIFIAWSSSSALTSDGSVAVVTFTVNSNAKACNTSLSWCMANIAVNDINGNDITKNINFANGAINIRGEGTTDECFIATAAFGSKFDWPVALLRHFRDQYLLTNSWGTAFVNCYYQYSPPIAATIATSQPLKLLVRILLAPIIAVVYIMYHPLMIIFLILLVGFLTYWFRFRRRYIHTLV